MNGIEKRMLLQNILFIGIGLGISFAVNIVMFTLLGDAAFPWNLVVTIVIFLAFGFYIQRRALRRAGVLPSKDSDSKKDSDSGKFGGLFSGLGNLGSSVGGGIKYTCYQCGHTHKGSVCDKCGARGGRVNF